MKTLSRGQNHSSLCIGVVLKRGSASITFRPGTSGLENLQVDRLCVLTAGVSVPPIQRDRWGQSQNERPIWPECAPFCVPGLLITKRRTILAIRSRAGDRTSVPKRIPAVPARAFAVVSPPSYDMRIHPPNTPYEHLFQCVRPVRDPCRERFRGGGFLRGVPLGLYRWLRAHLGANPESVAHI